MTYQYPEASEPVLKDFSLKAEPGETIALVGESGAGKSTVLNMLIGFMRPDSGEILLDGENMRNLDFRSFRRHLAVVPQETILFSGTVRQNITYGSADVTEEELWQVLKAANLDEVVKSCPRVWTPILENTEDAYPVVSASRSVLPALSCGNQTSFYGMKQPLPWITSPNGEFQAGF
ncbi:MAG: ATP-binding cassette domain-containing protein [Lachnospiraceae bacterium]